MTQPVTPDLTNAGMDVTELADGAKDVIASTAERFKISGPGLLTKNSPPLMKSGK